MTTDVKVCIKHIGHPAGPNSFKCIVTLEENAPIEYFETKIKNTLQSSELSLYSPFIEIYDKRVHGYVLFNEEYSQQNQTFKKQREHGNSLAKFRVRWLLKNKDTSVTTLGRTIPGNYYHLRFIMTFITLC